MKKIEPITIWSNGNNKEVNEITLSIGGDNMIDKCLFRYHLSFDAKIINQGSILINGDDYLNWSGTNDEAYNLVCTKLNLNLKYEE